MAYKYAIGWRCAIGEFTDFGKQMMDVAWILGRACRTRHEKTPLGRAERTNNRDYAMTVIGGWLQCPYPLGRIGGE